MRESLSLQPEIPLQFQPLRDEPIIDLSGFNVVVSLAARLVGACRSSLMLPSKADGVLCVAATSGIDNPAVKSARVRVGEPVAGLVAANREPVLVNDRKSRPKHRVRGYKSGSYISVPIPVDVTDCGVLNVADPNDAGGFRDDDLRALEGLAQQVSTSLSVQRTLERANTLERTVQQLRRQVVQVQEAERRRVARELHDEAGHALTAAILRLDLEMAQRSGDKAALNTLTTARTELVECAKSLHEIAFNLRPRILEDFGLHAALHSLARHVSETTGLAVAVDISGNEWAVDELEELAILRVVQEALTNARKHAHAQHVSVTLDYDGQHVILHVEDDGMGLGSGSPTVKVDPDRISMGINGMRERIELLGGTFWVGRGPQGGTLVSAMLPH